MSYVLTCVDPSDSFTKLFVSYFDIEGCSEDEDIEYVGISYIVDKELALSFQTYGIAEGVLYETGFSHLSIEPTNSETICTCCNHFLP